MWYVKLFSDGDLYNGTFDSELAENFTDNDGFIDYDEVLEHYQNCRARIDNIIHFLKTDRNAHAPEFEIPF